MQLLLDDYQQVLEAQALVNQASKYYTSIYYCFKLLQTYGFRINEIDNERMNLLANGDIQVITEKNNELRLFTPSEQLPFFTNLVASKTLHTIKISYNAMLHHFKQLTKGVSYRLGSKHISFHLFRHAYIKKLKLYGLTYIECAAYLGEKQVNSINTYYNSQIIKTYE